MSHSLRKTPIVGIANCQSEKKDKQLANRRFRRIVRYLIKSKKTSLPQIRELSNVWNFGKDGKAYIKGLDDIFLRK